MVSHYRIVERLGGGGMGVVYKASDSHLGRIVALKFLPHDLSQNNQALERFEREARSASALNHPNVCTIHDIDSAIVDGVSLRFIVMEFLDGQTLKHLLQKGALNAENMLDYAIQIANGLEAAHASGIIHRDLKPANIFVTHRGQVKILDFGLAKLVPESRFLREGGSEIETAERPESLTSPGTAVGTVAYMSPEQARALELDARTDIFSLGAVLYEMATGNRAFPGNSPAVIFEQILNQVPASPLQSNPKLPSDLERIIYRTLEKDREFRFQSTADLRAELKRIQRDFDSGRSASDFPSSYPISSRSEKVQAGKLNRKKSVIALSLILLLAAAIAAYRYWFQDLDKRETKLVQISHWNKPMWLARLSPDGNTVAFSSNPEGTFQVFVILTSGGEPLQLTRDEGDKFVDSFSADGTQIFYRRLVGQDEEWAIPTLGGSARRIVSGVRLVPSPDGSFYYYLKSADRSIYRVEESGLNEEKLYSFSEPHIPLSILVYPDGNHLLVSTGLNPYIPDQLELHRLDVTNKTAENLGKLEQTGSLLGGHMGEGVRWRVPGRTLLLSRTSGGLTNLWEYDLANHNLTQITFGPGPDFSAMEDRSGVCIKQPDEWLRRRSVAGFTRSPTPHSSKLDYRSSIRNYRACGWLESV